MNRCTDCIFKLVGYVKISLITFFFRCAQWLVRVVSKIPSNVHIDHYVFSPEKLTLPKFSNGKYLRIDVGLSDDASHSVQCLVDNDNRIIVGVEAHPKNLPGLLLGVPKFSSLSLIYGVVRRGYITKYIPDLKGRFFLIKGAAGSSPLPRERIFYSAFPDRGNSSFYNMQSVQLTGNIVDESISVVEFPLSMIFKKILEAGYSFVESLKIDTEGHELEVLRGCGEYLNNVLFCRVECFRGIYEKSIHVDPTVLPEHYIYGKDGYADSAKGIVDHLIDYGFRLISTCPGDYVFINENLEYLLDTNEVHP